MSSDQIAYLRELANSYFQEGNLSAAISTWEQVLSMDPSNLEAKQGLTLAQMKQQGQGLSPEPSGPDPDATMMFNVGDLPGFGQQAAPPAPGGGFDADRTMVFGNQDAPAPPAPGGGFDADRTMVFAPPDAAPRAAPGGGFDAERTMMFTPPAAQPPQAPVPPGAPQAPPGSGGFDADRTMAFNPSLAPPPAPTWEATPPAPAPPAPAPAPPAPPAPAPAAASDWLKPAHQAPLDADSTMMSPPSGSDFSLPPMSPPSSFSPPGFGGPPGSKPLEDFALPTAPPDLGTGPGMPPSPSGSTGGFSFELPPPPSKGGGGLPDLPSVGFSSPPPAFTPAPPPPPPVAGPPKKSGGQFGDVDPGEIESLAVPTLSPTAAPPDDATRKEREEQLKREYEQQYGRTAPTSPSSSPLPSRPASPPRPSVSPKFLIGLVIALAVILGGGYAGISWWQAQKQPGFVPPPPEKDPNVGLTKEQAESLMSQKLAEADKAQRAGNLADAERFIDEARDLALKNNLAVPQRVIEAGTELERERQYQESFQGAVRSFCQENYPKAHVALLDLERLRPDKKEAGQYIERIFWNLGVESLQKLQPWEAVYYLEGLSQRNPGDAEAASLLKYALQFQPGADLDDAYLQRVDPLSTRMAGCQ